MPRPSDFERRRDAYLDFARYLGFIHRDKKRKPPRRKGGCDLEREPVEPDKPRPLEGGAAAALGFDE